MALLPTPLCSYHYSARISLLANLSIWNILQLCIFIVMYLISVYCTSTQHKTNFNTVYTETKLSQTIRKPPP